MCCGVAVVIDFFGFDFLYCDVNYSLKAKIHRFSLILEKG
ncbi:hypothetical protein M595_3023 [Lyngbya aestuarii BL J]|uniref:Uncharacterized protein n=1 Tax=Lyngbya aestuarii BL J TaxID=1348334 RepID=U7QIT6_9CYAN|nr:hypothetical protein M595_3023 [Lyngbya aestuarii BL J]